MNNNVASKRDRMPSRIRLLNVEIDNISMDELVNAFRKGLLLTLHVDMIMKLQKDREFYETLPHFDVVTCDSQILFFAARWLGIPLKERVSGSDFFPRFYTKYKDDPSITIFYVRRSARCGGGGAQEGKRESRPRDNRCDTLLRPITKAALVR